MPEEVNKLGRVEFKCESCGSVSLYDSGVLTEDDFFKTIKFLKSQCLQKHQYPSYKVVLGVK